MKDCTKLKELCISDSRIFEITENLKNYLETFENIELFS